MTKTRKMVLLTMVFALVVAACGTGEQELGDAKAVAEAETLAMAAPVAAEAAPARGDSDVEGIEVHGHWTIEVWNPDGTLDERYEFENALTADGRLLLVSLLAGSANFTGIWYISVCENQNNVTCLLLEADATVVGAPEVLQLTGSALAEAPSTIGRVETFTGDLETSAGYYDFTEKALDTPIVVVEGQQIEVIVEISFLVG